MAQEFSRRGQSPPESVFTNVSVWVKEQINDIRDDEDQPIKSTLDHDETEWTTPAWCDFANSIGDQEHSGSFANRDIRNRKMSGAHLMMADLKSVNAQGVSFEKADLSFADGQNGNFHEANFNHADLAKIDLRNADLTLATFIGADLTQAVLNGADICGANFSGACLDDCLVEGTRYDSYTQLPFSLHEANRRGMHNVEQEAERANETDDQVPGRHL